MAIGSQSWAQLNGVEQKKHNRKKNSPKPEKFTGLGKIIFWGIVFSIFSLMVYLLSDLFMIDWLIDKIVHNFYS